MMPFIRDILHHVNQMMRQAEYYEELLEAFDPEKSDRVEYINYYHRIDHIWQHLDEARELGEGNDEILDAWEAIHKKACKIYSQIEN